MKQLFIVTSITLLLGAACDNDPAPDPCAGETCSGHGTCLVDADNQAYCECDTCYAADGLTCGREEVEVTSRALDEPTVWQSHQTIILTDYLDVSSELVIEECAEVRMLYDGAIYVLDNGSIKSQGSADHPVTFTSSEASPAAGDWRSIEIQSTAALDSSFDHTVFEYGGGGLTARGTLYVEGGATLAVTNSTFRDVQMHAVELDDGAIITEFADNSFDNIEAHLIQVYPDTVASLSPITSTNNVDEVVLVMGGDTIADGTWNDLQVPYETNGYIYILSDITVEAGVTLLMGDDLAVYVEDLGTLILDGTSDAHITVTSAQAAPVAGDWRNFEIDDTASTDSRFSFTDFSYGGATGGADSYGMLFVDDLAEIALEDVTFSNAMTCDVYQRGTINATNTTFNLCSP